VNTDRVGRAAAPGPRDLPDTSASPGHVTHADLGGRERPGAIVPEPEDERFHAAWERDAFALTLAMGASGAWNLDMSRAAREQLPAYDGLSYYEVWFQALQQLLVEHGILTADEIAQGRPLVPPLAGLRVLHAAEVASALRRGAPTERAATVPARFAPGERVRTRTGASPHHTRLPAYAGGRIGVVERAHGVHVFADAHAQGLGEQPQWLYHVVFDGTQLWGTDGSAAAVGLDLWESYLEPAGRGAPASGSP